MNLKLLTHICQIDLSTINLYLPNGLVKSTINPYLPNGLVHLYHLDESILNFRGVWCTLSFLSNRKSFKQTV